jgi:hypothetical protein
MQEQGKGRGAHRLVASESWRRAGWVGIALALVVSISMIVVGTTRLGRSSGTTGGPPVFGGAGPSPTSQPAAKWHNGDDALVDIRTGHPTSVPASIIALTNDVEFITNDVDFTGYAVSPDGTMLAVMANGIYVANIDGTGVRKVADYGGTGAHWSPDSSTIVYAVNSDLLTVDVATGETTVIPDLPSIVGAPTFGRDGDTILFTARRSDGRLDLRTMSVTGGKSRLFRRNAQQGAVSPDGTQLAYWHTGRDHGGSTTVYGLMVLDLADGTIVEPQGDEGYSGCMGFICGDDRRVPEWSPDGRRIVFVDEGSIGSTGSTFVMDATTGDVITIPSGDQASWLNDQMLIVGSYSRSDDASSSSPARDTRVVVIHFYSNGTSVPENPSALPPPADDLLRSADVRKDSVACKFVTAAEARQIRRELIEAFGRNRYASGGLMIDYGSLPVPVTIGPRAKHACL